MYTYTRETVGGPIEFRMTWHHYGSEQLFYGEDFVTISTNKDGMTVIIVQDVRSRWTKMIISNVELVSRKDPLDNIYYLSKA